MCSIFTRQKLINQPKYKNGYIIDEFLMIYISSYSHVLLISKLDWVHKVIMSTDDFNLMICQAVKSPLNNSRETFQGGRVGENGITSFQGHNEWEMENPREVNR